VNTNSRDDHPPHAADGSRQGDVLRHQLAEDHLRRGGQQQRQSYRCDLCDIGIEPEHAEWSQQKRRNRRLGHKADRETRDRDTQLGARQVRRQPLQGPPHPTEPYAALPGARLHEVAVHRYQRRLRSHEHRIPNNQDRSHT
jgi:hypothetical protein